MANTCAPTLSQVSHVFKGMHERGQECIVVWSYEIFLHFPLLFLLNCTESRQMGATFLTPCCGRGFVEVLEVAAQMLCRSVAVWVTMGLQFATCPTAHCLVPHSLVLRRGILTYGSISPPFSPFPPIPHVATVSPFSPFSFASAASWLIWLRRTPMLANGNISAHRNACM